MEPDDRMAIGKGSSAPISRRFTLRYVTALVLLAAVVVTTWTSVNASLRSIETSSKRLEAASSQPARLDRIVTLAQRLGAGPQADETRLLTDQLNAEVATLRQIEQALTEGVSTSTIPGARPTGALAVLYFGNDAHLDQNVKRIASAAESVASLASLGSSTARTQQIAVLQDNQSQTGSQLAQAVQLYAADSANAAARQIHLNTWLLTLYFAVSIGVVLLLFIPMSRSITSETKLLAAAERTQRENSERQTFRNDLARALEVTETEAEVLAAAGRAMTELTDQKTEILLADTGNAHLHRALVHPTSGGPRCPVESPQGCAAIRTSETMLYATSDALSVCPKLPQHEDAPCSSVSIPISFNGKALGVLHTIAENGSPTDPTTVERLGVLAVETGARLGHLRVMALNELQASTDPLTGLPNRRSLDGKSTAWLLSRRAFSIAIADIDHFKDLNDTYGHEAGDRALRFFASTLRHHLRPDDIAARLGGDEFVVLLPDTSIIEATMALRRLQSALAEDVERGATVPFTVSWGLTDTTSGIAFDEMLAVADSALYGAKRAGRNCILVDGEAAQAKEPQRGTRTTTTEPTRT